MYTIRQSKSDPGLTQTLRTVWPKMSLGQRRAALPPTMRLQDLSPKERLRGLTPEQLVMHLGVRERAALRQLLAVDDRAPTSGSEE